MAVGGNKGGKRAREQKAFRSVAGRGEGLSGRCQRTKGVPFLPLQSSSLISSLLVPKESKLYLAQSDGKELSRRKEAVHVAGL